MAAYRAALEERTRERVPLDWAYSQHSFGHALEALADRNGDRAVLAQAIDCMAVAAEFYRKQRVDLWLPLAEESLARMQDKFADLTALSESTSDPAG